MSGFQPVCTYVILNSSATVDCGDVPMSKFNNHVALDQLEDAYIHLLNKTTIDKKLSSTISKDGEAHPKMLTLGGDHTIVLPILRALEPVYGPITYVPRFILRNCIADELLVSASSTLIPILTPGLTSATIATGRTSPKHITRD